MLGSHGQAMTLGEFHNVLGFLSSGVPDCRVCGPGCGVWKKFKQKVRPPAYHQVAFEVFETKVLIDSSKSISWLEAVRPNLRAQVKIIRLTRRGEGALLESWRKSGRIAVGRVLNWVWTDRRIAAYVSGRPRRQ